MNIRIGTRGSPLAVVQATIIEQLLKSKYPNIKINTITIKTKGDITSCPLTQLSGDGFFTEALFNALMDDQIDLAVHSAKDLPTANYEGVGYYAVGIREDLTDTLLINKNPGPNPVIGTSSVRRALQILSYNPNAVIKPIRGNVDTRVNKILSKEFDGTVLATAGLNRLKIKPPEDITVKRMDFVTSPGQGILAIQVKEKFRNKIEKIINYDLDKILKKEKSYLKYLGGGCHLPFGCNIEKENLKIYYDLTKKNLTKMKSILGLDYSNDNSKKDVFISKHKVNSKIKCSSLESSFQKGIEQLFKINSDSNVWITTYMEQQLQYALSFDNKKAVCFPLIELFPIFSKKDHKSYNDFDCIVFPSKTAIQLSKIDLSNKHIFCMGKTSLKLLNNLGYTNVSIIKDINELKKYKKLLLVAAEYSLVAKRLEDNDISHTHLKLYKTKSIVWQNLPFKPDNKDSIIFTSPSTVISFQENTKIHPELLKLERFALGYTTQDMLEKFGLDNTVSKMSDINSLAELIENT